MALLGHKVGDVVNVESPNGNYEINSPKKIIDFMNYLTKAGFSSDFIEKFAYKNVERFLRRQQ